MPGLTAFFKLLTEQFILLILLIFSCEQIYAQKTLLLEKIGTRKKFYYHDEDKIKLRTIKPDTVFAGHIWGITEKNITLQTYVSVSVQLDNIGYIYRQYSFAKKFGTYLCIGSAVFFGVIAADHLLNNEQVFTPDMAYLTLPFLGAGIISLSLSQERFKIGPRWKIKILDFSIRL
jgi:hypothetical protein